MVLDILTDNEFQAVRNIINGCKALGTPVPEVRWIRTDGWKVTVCIGYIITDAVTVCFYEPLSTGGNFTLANRTIYKNLDGFLEDHTKREKEAVWST